MKKLLSATVIALFSLDLFLPLSVVFCRFLGYRFSLFSYSFFAIAIGTISLFLAVISFFCGNEPLGKTVSVFVSLLPVLTVINCVFSFFKCFEEEFLVIGISMLISLGSNVICSLRSGSPIVLSAFIIVVSLLAVLPVGVIGLFVWIMGDFGQNTVVNTILGPDGKCWVEVVDNDQGALGGATVVRICEDKGLNCFVFETEKIPEILYVGEWMEYADLDIYWKDDNTVVVGTNEYDVG